MVGETLRIPTRSPPSAPLLARTSSLPRAFGCRSAGQVIDLRVLPLPQRRFVHASRRDPGLHCKTRHAPQEASRIPTRCWRGVQAARRGELRKTSKLSTHPDAIRATPQRLSTHPDAIAGPLGPLCPRIPTRSVPKTCGQRPRTEAVGTHPDAIGESGSPRTPRIPTRSLRIPTRWTSVLPQVRPPIFQPHVVLSCRSTSCSAPTRASGARSVGRPRPSGFRSGAGSRWARERPPGTNCSPVSGHRRRRRFAKPSGARCARQRAAKPTDLADRRMLRALRGVIAVAPIG